MKTHKLEQMSSESPGLIFLLMAIQSNIDCMDTLIDMLESFNWMSFKPANEHLHVNLTS